MNKRDNRDNNLKNAVAGMIDQMQRRNDGGSLISDAFDKAQQMQVKRGRPKKGDKAPNEIKYTTTYNKSNLEKLKEISYLERVQIKDILGALLEMFIREYETEKDETNK